MNLRGGVLDVLDRPRWYYLRITAGLSACASLAAGLRVVADGNATVSELVASSAAAGLASLWVVGTISHWAAEMWRVRKLERVQIPANYPNLGAPQPQQVIRYENQYAADVQTYQPKIAILPNGAAGQTIHVTPEQLKILKRRIRTNQLGLPVNSLEMFSSQEVKDLRVEALRAGLAVVVKNNQVEWTGEGAVRVLRASPTEPIRAR